MVVIVEGGTKERIRKARGTRILFSPEPSLCKVPPFPFQPRAATQEQAVRKLDVVGPRSTPLDSGRTVCYSTTLQKRISGTATSMTTPTSTLSLPPHSFHLQASTRTIRPTLER